MELDDAGARKQSRDRVADREVDAWRKVAQREGQRMVSEKFLAAAKASTNLMAGASGDKIVEQYRRKVAATPNGSAASQHGANKDQADPSAGEFTCPVVCPPRTGGPPVTNIRNTSSPHWRGWLKSENRCLVPFNSFAEYAPEPNPETEKKDVVWFAVNDDRPLTALAGIWTEFKGARHEIEAGTRTT